MNRFTKISLSILLSFTSTILYPCNPCSTCDTSASCITEYGNSCCGGCSNSNHCECRVQSKSTFTMNPQWQVGSPEYLVGFRDRMDIRKNGHGGAFQAAIFGGKSTHSDRLAQYFTPYCKNKLVVSGTNGDICPQNFNVVYQGGEDAKYNGTISFCPSVSTVGLGLVYRQNINRFFDNYDPDKKHWYFEISTPLTHIETTMGLSECITTSGEALVVPGLDQTFYNSMTQAFNQPSWKYGKISNCSECSKTRLADITVMIGYETLKCSSVTLDGYVGLLIPTGNKRCNKYVFEPLVGHDRHWGIIKGMHLKGTFWENEAGDILLEAAHDINGMYLFEREQIRSFDLKGKPWSRYMEVYTSEEQAQEAAALETAGNLNAAQYLSSPGINTFTQCVDVRPGLSTAINTSLILSSKKFRGEIGYNMFWRQSECLNLCCWKECAAIKATEGGGNTMPLRTISRDNSIYKVNKGVAGQESLPDKINITTPIEQYSISIIKKCDLDLESATHPSMLINTLYLSAGGHFDEREYPLFFDLGGSYEFDFENVTLNRWTVWAKGGISF